MIGRISLLIFCAVGGACSQAETSAAPWHTSTSEAELRKRATHLVRPDCPSSPTGRGTVDVTVAQVHLSASGRVLEAEILEAPAADVAVAVTRAVREWRFGTSEPIAGRPQLLTAKLTFYRDQRGDNCRMLHPAEVGYVGRWPTAPARPSAQAALQTAGPPGK